LKGTEINLYDFENKPYFSHQSRYCIAAPRVYSTTEISNQENTVVTHEAIQKYIHKYTSILSTYATYTNFKWLSRISVCLNIILVLFEIMLSHS
jgi:hypothetical protein